MTAALDAIVFAAALSSGLVAGVFFAFSSFVMGALGRLAPSIGTGTMQSINVVVLTPWFLVPFLGTALLCVVAAGLVLAGAATAAPTAILAGAGIYVFGCLGVTILANIPRNDRLAVVDADDPAAEPVWRDYLRTWTFWNTVRTAAAIAAAACFTVALRGG